jgi:S-DNA-T family DNA segregation ATPase FtsK/SpoIIIE
MALIDRGYEGMDLMSGEFGAAVRRRLRECAGFGLIALAVMSATALATWSVKDPSFSHATTAPVRNLLGTPGAVASDLLMQLVGIAAVAFLLPIAIWGWRLMTHRPMVRERWRALAWIAGVLLASGFASCLPKSTKWPLPTGLGGVVGDAILRVPGWLIGVPSGLGAMLIGIVLGGGALFCLAIAAGFGWTDIEEEEEEERPRRRSRKAAVEEDEDEDDAEPRSSWISRVVSIGAITHGFLSLKARVIRLFDRPKPVKAAEARKGPRIEPRLNESQRVPLAPELDSDVEEEAEEDEEEEQAVAPRPRKPVKVEAPPVKGKRGGFQLPPLTLLALAKSGERTQMSPEVIQAAAVALEGVLGDFGVRGEIINARPGPVVTLYELEPAPGIKSSRVIGLADDIARSMSAVSARVAVVAGRNAIGIELPNPTREKVYFRELLAVDDYNESSAKLPLCLGKNIGGESIIVDLARMPHLLIAGTTGSGKSVAINTMILSLVYRLKPEQCRLIMVDPKMLELSVYDGIPHLLTPVVTDPKKAVVALKWAVREMEERYKKMSKLGVRNIDGYNVRIAEAKAKGEQLTRTVHTGYDKESGEAIYEEEGLEFEALPYIVVIVDEMADLMMVAGKDIEGAIQRLAQMARAAGIHVVLATQRPSVDVITGTIKANFPTRISFQVTSKIDSRTILGEQGAEQLLGQGDMLYMAGGGRISRVHGPFVSDDEVEKVVRHLKSQGAPQYLEAVTASDEELEGEDGAVFDAGAMGSEGLDLYTQAVQIVLRDRKASTSYIQRRLQIGYNRAATLMERMELEGVVGQPNHAGKREILLGEEHQDKY